MLRAVDTQYVGYARNDQYCNPPLVMFWRTFLLKYRGWVLRSLKRLDYELHDVLDDKRWSKARTTSMKAKSWGIEPHKRRRS